MTAIPPVASSAPAMTLMADTHALSYAVLIHQAGAIIMQIDGVGVNAGEMGNPNRGMYLLEAAVTQIGGSSLVPQRGADASPDPIKSSTCSMSPLV